MLKKFVHTIVRRHHFWRGVTFDELAEIYTSMSLRSFGFGIVGIFVPVYLYTNEVSLRGIFLFYSFFFLFRIPVSFFAAYVVGRIGPKHTIAVSTLVTIIFFGLLLSYSLIGWPLVLLALVFSLANGLFFIAYNVDFSKIKDSQHGGKELGWLYIFDSLGRSAGPLVGGFVAAVIAPEATLGLAILVMLGSLIPLFMSREPVRVHQKISFKKFSVRSHTRDFMSVSALGLQLFTNGVLWPLLVVVVVFTEDTYVKLGAVVAFAMIISMFSAHMFGRFIDSKKGLSLLRYGSLMNVALSFSRAIINATGGVVAVSTLGEPIVLSYRMPLIKGLFDAGDSVEGFRIVYFAWAEMIAGLLKAVFCLVLLSATYFFDPVSVLRFSFVIVGLVGLVMLTQKFPALKKAS